MAKDIINEYGARVFLIPGWLDTTSAITLFERLKVEVQWSRPVFAGQYGPYQIPREMAFYGDANVAQKTDYLPWEAVADVPSLNYIHLLEDSLEKVAGQPFNSCALNHYRDENDRIAPHSDNEVSRQAPAVAALSLGATRRFRFISKADPKRKLEFLVNNGDLMVMLGTTQMLWKHEVPKQPASMGNAERISVTYRFLDI